MTKVRSLMITITFVLITACATAQAQSQGKGPPGAPDLSAAAATLGVSEDALDQAIRNAGGPPPDMEKVASALGVSVEDLKNAMPPPPGRSK